MARNAPSSGPSSTRWSTTPAAVAAGGLGFRPGPAALGLLIALGTGPTAVAYTLYFRGLRTAAASTGASATRPVCAT